MFAIRTQGGRSRPLAPLALAVALLTGLPAPALAQNPALPLDLHMVPPDALAFVHVKLGDIWRADALAQVRAVLDKAGPGVLKALNSQFAPDPFTVESATGYLMPQAEQAEPFHPAMIPVLILRHSEPFDAGRVRASWLPDGENLTVEGKTYHIDHLNNLAVHFADDRTIVLYGTSDLTPVLSRKVDPPDMVLREALAAAAAGPALSAAVSVARLPIPPEAREEMPEEFRPLLKAKLVSLTVGGQQPRVRLRATFPTDGDAAAALKALRNAANLARMALAQQRRDLDRILAGAGPDAGPRPIEQLPEALGAAFGIGYLNMADELLANPPLAHAGLALESDLPVPTWIVGNPAAVPILIGMLLPAVQKVREAAAQTTASNNLMQIGLALHNHEDAMGHLPAAAITDKKSGKRLLSWRVAILPYLDQVALYERFKLDEPWDSEHNKALIPLIPKVFADPRATAGESGMTYYKACVGKDALLAWDKGRQFREVTDGLSNTIMVIAGGSPVIWTKPDDFEFDPKKPLPDLKGPFPSLKVLLADGSVRVIAPGTDEKTIKAMITHNGGEFIALP